MAVNSPWQRATIQAAASYMRERISQGAASIKQFELLPRPPEKRGEPSVAPWPYWPMILRTSSSHEEGGFRDWSISTKRFSGSNGKLEKLHGVRVEFGAPDATGRRPMNEVPDSEFEIEVDLVLLALGFLGPEQNGMVKDLGVKLDSRGNVAADKDHMTSEPGIFAAGDMRRGQSLVELPLISPSIADRLARRAPNSYMLSGKQMEVPRS
jgi:glutamate synthase (NADPH/NADH) small chain